ncbi:hypothetical protein [Chitinophaga sp.]|uniref:hypothetical protein n=1 Tax=Chitinophaga sp. TaxID=1869181 RepID=UPI002F921F9D
MNTAINCPYAEISMKRIFDFLVCYDMEDAEGLLWDMLMEAMKSDDVDDWSSSQRAEMMLFYQLLRDVIGSIYWIAIPLMEHFGHEAPSSIYNSIPKCWHCITNENSKS